MGDKKKSISDLGVKLLAGVTLVVIGVCAFTVFVINRGKTFDGNADMILTIIFGLVPTGIGFYMLCDGIAMICHTVEKIERMADELEKKAARQHRRS